MSRKNVVGYGTYKTLRNVRTRSLSMLEDNLQFREVGVDKLASKVDNPAVQGNDPDSVQPGIGLPAGPSLVLIMASDPLV